MYLNEYIESQILNAHRNNLLYLIILSNARWKLYKTAALIQGRRNAMSRGGAWPERGGGGGAKKNINSNMPKIVRMFID